MTVTASLTSKGAATRDRIVVAAADLVLERGARGTSLDDIRAATQTSKSQLFHYFPEGKGELIGAIAALQAERVLDAQRPYLDRLDSWADWDGWRAAVIEHYASQRHLRCPIGALTAELIASEPERAVLLTAHMDRWRGFLTAGVRRMIDGGLLATDTDPETLALSVFAALQGGLALMAMSDSIEPLSAALDGALSALRAHAAPAR
jgi:AcrR family transcriptional regulator